MLSGTLAPSLVENMLAGKPKIPGWGVTTADEGTIRAREGVIRASNNFLLHLSFN